MASPTSLDLLAPVHRLTIEEYQRIAESGVFDEGPRVELIEGVIVEMSPMGNPHRLAVMWLTREVVPQLDAAHILSPQQCISLPEQQSMPEPDIAILDVAEALEGLAEEPLLVIEVSDSSLRYDRITKARLYAQSGLSEYWIVNVAEQVVEVHAEPVDGVWTSRAVHGPQAVLEPVRLPGVAVPLAGLFAFMAAGS